MEPTNTALNGEEEESSPLLPSSSQTSMVQITGPWVRKPTNPRPVDRTARQTAEKRTSSHADNLHLMYKGPAGTIKEYDVVTDCQERNSKDKRPTFSKINTVVLKTSDNKFQHVVQMSAKGHKAKSTGFCPVPKPKKARIPRPKKDKAVKKPSKKAQMVESMAKLVPQPAPGCSFTVTGVQEANGQLSILPNNSVQSPIQAPVPRGKHHKRNKKKKKNAGGRNNMEKQRLARKIADAVGKVQRAMNARAEKKKKKKKQPVVVLSE